MKIKANKAIENGMKVYKMSLTRARKLKCIPKFGLTPQNKKLLLAIYIKCQLLNLTQRLRMEVDHILPLNNPLICGLHVPENLQIISKTKNTNKSNAFTCYREVDGKKYYYDISHKQKNLPKSFNQTKKNPTKLRKKRLKTPKVSVRKKSGLIVRKNATKRTKG